MLETLAQVFVVFFQYGSDSCLALVKHLASFLKTNIGKLIFGEILSGSMITPLSLVSSLIWSIAEFIFFKNSKHEKWIMSFITFSAGILLSVLGLPDWCQIFLPTIIIVITMFLQSRFHNNMVSNGKKPN